MNHFFTEKLKIWELWLLYFLEKLFIIYTDKSEIKLNKLRVKLEN